MENLALFEIGTCPYCQKVLSFIDKHHLDIKMLNIGQEENKKDLLRLGGEEQVPALLIGDKVLYESDDIIKYLAKINNISTTDEDFEAEISYCPIY
ncbi:MAG: glutathione S-transferase N-terminal domain-containing protein [Bacillota bacterium]|nr:glutathione S-transferase N-terminal domain-containing protein [Bacillota bacterium]